MNVNTGRAAYDAAYEKYSAAFAEFQVVRLRYRAGEIGDAEFVEARRLFDAAQLAVDAAEEEIRRERS